MPTRVQTELHIEVYEFHPGAAGGVTVAALVLQAFLPIYFRRTVLLRIASTYYPLLRPEPLCNPSVGPPLPRTVIGLLQDNLSRPPIGL